MTLQKAHFCSDMYEIGTGTIESLLGTVGTISYFNLMLLLSLIAANRYFAIARAVKVSFSLNSFTNSCCSIKWYSPLDARSTWCSDALRWHWFEDWFVWDHFNRFIAQSIHSHTTGQIARRNLIHAGWVSLTPGTSADGCSIGIASFCALLLRFFRLLWTMRRINACASRIRGAVLKKFLWCSARL